MSRSSIIATILQTTRAWNQTTSFPYIKTKKEIYGHVFRRSSRTFLLKGRRPLKTLHISEAVWSTLLLPLSMKITTAFSGLAPWEGLTASIGVLGKTPCPPDPALAMRYFPFSKTAREFSSQAPTITDLN